MNSEFINIYNNLVNLSRNKNIYYHFTNNDTFSDRLMIFLFHLAFFLKNFKSKIDPKYMQNFYDYTFKQIELDSAAPSIPKKSGDASNNGMK